MIYGSICSGIESASMAWEPLGMRPAWFAEIEAFPSAVLDHHWPDVANLGDMCNLPYLVAAGLIDAPDILVGGTPCQAFSVAGLRKGLEDERGQLTLKFVELANEIDKKRKGNECITVWENVPGVLSSKDNAFGCFLGALAGEECELKPAGGKWTNAGCVFGPKRAIAWRILNAQYFGVAQRRRRVFVVASARKGFDPSKVLFECEGVRRDIAPGRETQTHVAALTANGSHWDDTRSPHPTLNQSHNTGGIGASNQEVFSQRGAGSVYQEVSHCLNAGGMGRIDYETESTTIDSVHGTNCPARTLLGKSNDSIAIDIDTYVIHNLAVRRLTPVECERLQGFPDNHTLLPYGVKQKLDVDMRQYYERHLGRALTDNEQRELCADGPRYKAIGNSKAVPVIKFIGERILYELNTMGD